MSIIIFDTETTGLLAPSCSEHQPRIIEFGALKIDSKANVIDTLSQLINPEVEIPKKITKLTGITPECVAGKPIFVEFFSQLEEFFSDVDVMICHNAPFDTGMLNVEFKRTGLSFKLPSTIICTVLEYRHVFGKYIHLKELYKHILGVELAQTHRALDDCRALYDVLKKDNFLSSININVSDKNHG